MTQELNTLTINRSREHRPSAHGSMRKMPDRLGLAEMSANILSEARDDSSTACHGECLHGTRFGCGIPRLRTGFRLVCLPFFGWGWAGCHAFETKSAKTHVSNCSMTSWTLSSLQAGTWANDSWGALVRVWHFRGALWLNFVWCPKPSRLDKALMSRGRLVTQTCRLTAVLTTAYIPAMSLAQKPFTELLL